MATVGKSSPTLIREWRMPTLGACGLALLAALGLLLFPPTPVFGTLVLLVLAGALFAAPRLGLYLLPAGVAFGSAVALTAKGVHVGPTDLIVGFLALVALGWVAMAARSDVPRRSLALGLRRMWATDRLAVSLIVSLIAYVVVIALTVAVASDRVAVLKEILKWSEVTAVVALGLWLLRTPRHVRWLLWAAIAIGLAEALLGFGQWVFAQDGSRSFGTFDQPNPYAGYLNLSLPLALAIAAFGDDARERWLAAGASVVLGGALALSGSRGGLLGIAAAIVILAIVGARKERLAVTAAAIALPLLAVAWFAHLIPASLQAKLLHPLRLDDVSLSGPVTAANFSTMERLAHWVAGLRMFAAHPLLGVGAGNYNAAYPRFTVDPVVWYEPLGHAHNYYINAAAETGALGLLAYLAVLALVLVASWRAVKCARRYDARSNGAAMSMVPYAMGIFAALVAFAVHNLTDNLYVHAMELQFALYVACALVLARMVGREGRTQESA